jgi:hypothetical protein
MIIPHQMRTGYSMNEELPRVDSSGQFPARRSWLSSLHFSDSGAARTLRGGPAQLSIYLFDHVRQATLRSPTGNIHRTSRYEDCPDDSLHMPGSSDSISASVVLLVGSYRSSVFDQSSFSSIHTFYLYRFVRICRSE